MKKLRNANNTDWIFPYLTWVASLFEVFHAKHGSEPKVKVQRVLPAFAPYLPGVPIAIGIA